MMPWPYWTSASDRPWTCWNYRAIMILSSTEGCHRCPMWTARQVVHSESAIPPVGAIPLPGYRNPTS
jgi:hypothetical protein